MAQNHTNSKTIASLKQEFQAAKQEAKQQQAESEQSRQQKELERMHQQEKQLRDRLDGYLGWGFTSELDFKPLPNNGHPTVGFTYEGVNFAIRWHIEKIDGKPYETFSIISTNHVESFPRAICTPEDLEDAIIERLVTIDEHQQSFEIEIPVKVKVTAFSEKIGRAQATKLAKEAGFSPSQPRYPNYED